MFRSNLVILFSFVLLVLNSALGQNNCEVIYISTTGNGLGTKVDPADLETTLNNASSQTIYRIATGNYTIDNPISLTDSITIEGGFDEANNWVKTSLPGATTINRSQLNPEGPANNQRLVAFYGIQKSGFRFQDITITTANGSGNGMSTYGLYLNSCSNYKIVRSQILSGNASNGANGTDGAPGVVGEDGIMGGDGDNDSDGMIDAGFGGNGGNGGSSSGSAPAGGVAGTTNGIAGSSGTSLSRDGGAGGAGGAGGWDGSPADSGYDGGGGGAGGTPTGISNVNCGGTGSGGDGGASGDPGEDGGNGANGVDGANGANGTVSPQGVLTANYFETGAQAESGENGEGGTGGCGGGGGGPQICLICLDGAGNGGSGGGGGGEGGEGGSGGFGGGSSFGLYIVDNGTNSEIIQSFVTSGTLGLGGQGGMGGDLASNGPGTGARGGFGGASNTFEFDEIGSGGAGGDGGSGGIGGNGADGADGLSIPIYTHSGNPLSTDESNYNLAGLPEISADENICLSSLIEFNDITSTGETWNFGTDATPQNSNSNPISVSFQNGGRKSIDLGVNSYEGFIYVLNNTIPEAGSNQNLCNQNTSQISGIFGNSGTNEWSSLGLATISNIYSENITVADLEQGENIFVLTNSNCCGTVYDSVRIFNNSVTDLTVTQNGINLSSNNINADYQWLDCDNNFALIQGETNSLFTAIQNGNYAVEITENGCTDTSSCYSISTVGIQNQTLFKNTKLFPNPTRNELNLQFNLDAPANLDITIRNTVGQIMKSQKISANTEELLTINVGDLVEGIYFIEIRNKEVSLSLKFSKTM